MSEDDVRVSNDDSRGAAGVFSDLLKLQTEFQARLAEETLTYLRRLQGAAAPAAPGTVLVPEGGAQLTASGTPGSAVTLALEIENRQRVHTVVTPMLGPLVSAEGVTWFPAADPSPPSTLVAPGQVRALSLAVTLPAEIRPGTYRGALVLQGFGDGGVSVAIEVPAPEAPKSAAPRRRAAASRAKKRT
jgi:hypothetical protein